MRLRHAVIVLDADEQRGDAPHGIAHLYRRRCRRLLRRLRPFAQPRGGSRLHPVHLRHHGPAQGRHALASRGDVRVCAGAADLWELVPSDRLSNHSRLTFDVSMFDIFAGFLAGATVCPIIGAKDLTFPGDFIRSRAITVWCSAPSVIGMMIKSRQLAAGPFAAIARGPVHRRGAAGRMGGGMARSPAANAHLQHLRPDRSGHLLHRPSTWMWTAR